MTSEVDDPVAKILQMATTLKFDQEKIFIHSISDSGAQDLVKIIEGSLKQPHWVVIENLHGSLVGLNALATYLDQLTGDTAHPDFRLWITTRPLEGLAKSLLQKSVKMIDAPKDGLKGLVKRALVSEFPSQTKIIEASPQKTLLQSLIPGLCLFHGVIQKRHKFKPRGWTFDYEFNDSDLQMSFKVLFDALNGSPEESQLEGAIYSIGQLIYGGQISDPWDEKVLRELANEFLNLEDIKENKIKGLIDGLTRNTDAKVLGLHRDLSVDVSFKMMEENLKKLLNSQDRRDLVGQEVQDEFQVALRKIESVGESLPKEILDEETAVERFGAMDGLMGNVLMEEVRLYNGLLGLIQGHLEDLRKHLKGKGNGEQVKFLLIIISPIYTLGTGNILLNMDKDVIDIGQDRLPNNWRSVCYLSCLSLESFSKDLKERFQFMEVCS